MLAGLQGQVLLANGQTGFVHRTGLGQLSGIGPQHAEQSIQTRVLGDFVDGGFQRLNRLGSLTTPIQGQAKVVGGRSKQGVDRPSLTVGQNGIVELEHSRES